MSDNYEYEKIQVKEIIKKSFDIVAENTENNLFIGDVLLSIFENKKHEEFDEFIFLEDYLKYDQTYLGNLKKYTKDGDDLFYRFYFLIINKHDLDVLKVNFRLYCDEFEDEKGREIITYNRIEFED